MAEKNDPNVQNVRAIRAQQARQDYRMRRIDVSITRYAPALELPSADCYDSGRLLEDLRRTTSWMTEADVPVCSTLSGGVDSSLVATLSSSNARVSDAFNVWYEGDWQEDETAFAKMVADNAHLRYHQVTVEDRRFPDLIQRMCRALSQPNAAAHCLSTFRLYEATAAAGFRVALVGEGADDFFGGYGRMVHVARTPEPEEAFSAYIGDLSAVPSSLRSMFLLFSVAISFAGDRLVFDAAFTSTGMLGLAILAVSILCFQYLEGSKQGR